MNPRTKLAFFGDDDDDLSLLQSKPIDDQKAKTYTQGVQRKTKREKEKEAEAAKKEEEEREAARAYAEFLDAFDSPSTSASGLKGRTPGFVKASDASGKSQVYNPLARDDEGVPTGPRVRNREPTPPPPSSAPKPKGKRAMDMFLEELKRDQADREARLKGRTQVTGSSVTALAAFEGQHGSRDRGDPLTTNVFVANLPMGVTEHSLGMFFARHGPVGSVKIMWPRGDSNTGPGSDITARRGKGAGMSGFVSYMTRRSAEECVRDMDGFTWNGSVLRVGWSKAVPIAARPAYVLDDNDSHRRSRSRSRSRSHSRERNRRPAKRARYDRSASRSRSRSYSPQRKSRHSGRRRSRSRSSTVSSRSRSRSRSRDRRRRSHRSRSKSTSRHHSRSRSRSRSYERRDRRDYESSRRRKHSRSRSYSRSRSPSPQRRWPPIEDETRKFVVTVAERVKKNGSKFGDMLRHKERDNTKFSFLYDKRMPEYHLFHSIVERDYKCPYADIPFNDDGGVSPYSTDSEEEYEKERVRKGSLGRVAQRRFENMLRTLSGRKGEIAACMVFSLEHADAVTEVVDIIISSLLVEETPVPRKIARLHVICDILHNSAATIPNAWKFRQEFQARLPAVFDHLCEIYQSFPGRITADTFKKQVLAVVEVWEDWIIFPPDFTTEMRMRLEGVKQVEGQTEGALMESSTGGDPSDGSSGPSNTLPSKFRPSGFKPAELRPAEEDEDMDIDDSDADLEGEAIGDDLDM